MALPPNPPDRPSLRDEFAKAALPQPEPSTSLNQADVKALIKDFVAPAPALRTLDHAPGLNLSQGPSISVPGTSQVQAKAFAARQAGLSKGIKGLPNQDVVPLDKNADVMARMKDFISGKSPENPSYSKDAFNAKAIDDRSK